MMDFFNANSVYREVPEQIVIESSQLAKKMGEPNTNFDMILSAGAQFKAADMTPVYLLDLQKMDLLVVAKETVGKKLH
jgi:hypothetical protein